MKYEIKNRQNGELARHTPTPCEIGDVISHSYLSEYTTFVIKAVNCHEELLESLRECVQLMSENVNYQEDKDFKLIVDSAYEVIAKAERK